MTALENIDLTNIPQHVAIIMDGNGRWAKGQGMERVYGHEKGVTTVRTITEVAAEMGVKWLTLYTFSTENWNRPKYEVDALMSLLVHTAKGELPTLMKNNIRLTTIGDFDSLPEHTRNELQETMNATKDNTRMTLVLALSYSSRLEILDAVKSIATQVKAGTLAIENITDELISNHLYTKGMPEPELLIRTSGEIRISNFLLWQIAYSELYFTDLFWPDFDKESFHTAILDYQNRERRFGLVSEQVK
jgi:undecaprenyl diphosphate synthase